MIKIYIVDYHEIVPYKDKALELISGERVYKALKYIKEEDTLRSITGSLLIKKYAGGLDGIKYDFYGKPCKDNYFFSLSHSNSYVVLAVADSEIGVDIEMVRSRNPKLADYVLSDNEKAALKEEMDFYRLWTSKESLVKFVGFGIDRDLKLIPALPLNGPKEYVGKKAYALNFDYDNNYTISVTTENKQDYEVIVEHADGLLQ